MTTDLVSMIDTHFGVRTTIDRRIAAPLPLPDSLQKQFIPEGEGVPEIVV